MTARVCGRLQVGVLAPILVLLMASASQAGPPAQERASLLDASNGNLKGVFLVRFFGGYVAFPRSSIVADISRQGGTRIEIGAPDVAHGTAYLGWFVRTSDGKRTDIEHSRSLPSNPAHIEQRGDLTVEYFGTLPNVVAVLIYKVKYNSGQYVLLLGSAAELTNEFVRAAIGLIGPPAITSKNWRPVASWTDLPQYASKPETNAPASSVEDVMSCLERLDMTASESGPSGSQWAIFNPFAPGDRENTFARLGLLPRDKVIGVNGRAIKDPKEWLKALEDAHDGQRVDLSVSRTTSRATVLLQKAAVDAVFGECWGSDAVH